MKKYKILYLLLTGLIAVIVCSSNTDICFGEIKNDLKDTRYGDARIRFAASGKDINDYGRSDICTTTVNPSRYVILKVHMYNMPSAMVIGLCVPLICDQASVDEIASKANQLLDDEIAPFFQKFQSLDSTFGSFSFSTTALLPDQDLKDDEEKQIYPFAGLLILLVILLILQVTGFIEQISQRSKAVYIRPEHASVAREQLSELQFQLYIDDPLGEATPQRLQSLQVRESSLMKKIETLQPKQSFAQSDTSSIFDVGP